MDLGIVFPLFKEITIPAETVGHSPASIGSLICRIKSTTAATILLNITMLILAQAFYNCIFHFQVLPPNFVFITARPSLPYP